jgi:hypothetical protein
MLSAALLFALFQSDKPAVPPAEGAPAPVQDTGAQEPQNEPQNEPQPAPAPAAKRPPRADAINGIQFVVNEEAVTKREFINDLRRRNRPNSTPQELERALQDTFYENVELLLMEQGGRELGYDESIVQRYVDDSIKDNIKDYGGIVDLGEELRRKNIDPVELREIKRKAAYRELWGYAVDGRQPGASGRPSVDRYVRPGRLLFEYERSTKAELAPVLVQFQEVFLSADAAGGAKAALERANEVVEQARSGANFTELVRDRSNSTTKVRDGWQRKLPLEFVIEKLPDVGEFVASATPQSVSDPIPERVDGELIGFRVIASVTREQPEVHFMSTKAQDDLRSRLLEVQSRYRRDRELARMLDAAFVWPPEHFRRPAKR